MSRSRTIGFGTGEGTEGVVVSPDIAREQANPELAAAEYLREIRDRYVLPGGLQTLPFNLAANQARKFDLSQTTYNGFILTVTAGVCLVYLGDFTNVDGQAGNIPHLVLSSALSPATQQFLLPPGPYVITVQADNSGACTGCVIPTAL